MITLPIGSPIVHAEAWVAPGAVLAGAVSIDAGVSVWYAAVLRADLAGISLGAGTNIQDGAVLHADPGFPLSVGAGVSVGHRAVLHGCTIGDGTLIGMGAVVMNGARVGAGCLIAAGAVVLEGSELPAGSLVAGLPAKVRRPLSESEREGLGRNAEIYRDLAKMHRSAQSTLTP